MLNNHYTIFVYNRNKDLHAVSEIPKPLSSLSTTCARLPTHPEQIYVHIYLYNVLLAPNEKRWPWIAIIHPAPPEKSDAHIYSIVYVVSLSTRRRPIKYVYVVPMHYTWPRCVAPRAINLGLEKKGASFTRKTRRVELEILASHERMCVVFRAEQRDYVVVDLYMDDCIIICCRDGYNLGGDDGIFRLFVCLHVA